MDYWSNEKVDRVLSLLNRNVLHPDATVLEFGCGTGTFLTALKTRYPDLNVHGCDISPIGVQKARARCPNATLHVLREKGADPPLPEADIVYTHHVLEHVENLELVVAEIANHLGPNGRVIHIAPCANSGSVEHWLALRMRHGFSADGSGLFYLDDISHVRRLTSQQLEEACLPYGLMLRERSFANQFWGAFEYLSGQLYWKLAAWLNPIYAKNRWAAIQLWALLALLMPLSLLRTMPSYILRTCFRKRPVWKRIVFLAGLPLCICLYPLSKILDATLVNLREHEWNRHKNEPNGSEMYLVFSKYKREEQNES